MILLGERLVQPAAEILQCVLFHYLLFRDDQISYHFRNKYPQKNWATHNTSSMMFSRFTNSLGVRAAISFLGSESKSGCEPDQQWEFQGRASKKLSCGSQIINIDFGCKFEQSPSTKLKGYILLHLESVA